MSIVQWPSALGFTPRSPGSSPARTATLPGWKTQGARQRPGGWWLRARTRCGRRTVTRAPADDAGISQRGRVRNAEKSQTGTLQRLACRAFGTAQASLGGTNDELEGRPPRQNDAWRPRTHSCRSSTHVRHAEQPRAQPARSTTATRRSRGAPAGCSEWSAPRGLNLQPREGSACRPPPPLAERKCIA